VEKSADEDLVAWVHGQLAVGLETGSNKIDKNDWAHIMGMFGWSARGSKGARELLGAAIWAALQGTRPAAQSMGTAVVDRGPPINPFLPSLTNHTPP